MAVPWTDYVVIDSTKLLAIVKYFRFEVVVVTPIASFTISTSYYYQLS